MKHHNRNGATRMQRQGYDTGRALPTSPWYTIDPGGVRTDTGAVSQPRVTWNLYVRQQLLCSGLDPRWLELLPHLDLLAELRVDEAGEPRWELVTTVDELRTAVYPGPQPPVGCKNRKEFRRQLDALAELELIEREVTSVEVPQGDRLQRLRVQRITLRPGAQAAYLRKHLPHVAELLGPVPVGSNPPDREQAGRVETTQPQVSPVGWERPDRDGQGWVESTRPARSGHIDPTGIAPAGGNDPTGRDLQEQAVVVLRSGHDDPHALGVASATSAVHASSQPGQEPELAGQPDGPGQAAPHQALPAQFGPLGDPPVWTPAAASWTFEQLADPRQLTDLLQAAGWVGTDPGTWVARLGWRAAAIGPLLAAKAARRDILNPVAVLRGDLDPKADPDNVLDDRQVVVHIVEHLRGQVRRDMDLLAAGDQDAARDGEAWLHFRRTGIRGFLVHLPSGGLLEQLPAVELEQLAATAQDHADQVWGTEHRQHVLHAATCARQLTTLAAQLHPSPPPPPAGTTDASGAAGAHLEADSELGPAPPGPSDSDDQPIDALGAAPVNAGGLVDVRSLQSQVRAYLRSRSPGFDPARVTKLTPAQLSALAGWIRDGQAPPDPLAAAEQLEA